MINKEKTQIKVGIFIFFGLILAMYVIFMLGGEKELFESRYKLIANFRDISGLRTGAPIQLAGLKVGFVDQVKFPESLAAKDIMLTLMISKKFQTRIRQDSIATVNTQGLLGDKFIYISVGSEDQPVLKDNDAIESRETVSLYDFAEKSSEILEDVKNASTSVAQFFTDMSSSKKDMKETLRSMRDILGQVKSGKGLVGAMLYDPKGKDVVSDIGASLKMLRDIIGRVDDEDKKTAAVGGILKNLRQASDDLKDVMNRINNGQGTIGGLVNDPSIYNDLRSLMGRANRNRLLKAVIRSTLAENDKKVMGNE
ncbi:MAG: hypothetical protein COV46_08750 [Deltaproteobacteria bacterium CG11_big_fil_rev_8_21_14_0_20_49_13]|nr:MAG: hypothetical protein COV46_08750 [Deltaproteobacteria bacterium CG11_big_fil_rev_8_21_14_0_20_49_13]